MKAAAIAAAMLLYAAASEHAVAQAADHDRCGMDGVIALLVARDRDANLPMNRAKRREFSKLVTEATNRMALNAVRIGDTDAAHSFPEIVRYVLEPEADRATPEQLRAVVERTCLQYGRQLYRVFLPSVKAGLER